MNINPTDDIDNSLADNTVRPLSTSENLLLALVIGLACKYLSEQVGQTQYYWSTKFRDEANQMLEDKNIPIGQIEQIMTDTFDDGGNS